MGGKIEDTDKCGTRKTVTTTYFRKEYSQKIISLQTYICFNVDLFDQLDI
jgi:hypothetical protein